MSAREILEQSVSFRPHLPRPVPTLSEDVKRLVEAAEIRTRTTTWGAAVDLLKQIGAEEFLIVASRCAGRPFP